MKLTFGHLCAAVWLFDGQGGIRKRADGRWEGRYTAGYNPETGKWISKNVLGKTQAEVKEKLARAIEERKQLDVSRTNEYTVAEWLRLWFELYSKPHVRPSTADYYRRSIEQYTIPRIGNIKLNKLTGRDIQKLYKDLQENGRGTSHTEKDQPGSEQQYHLGNTSHAAPRSRPRGKGTLDPSQLGRRF